MSDRIAGILLAGGSSTRMGHPKATLPWGDGETFVSVEVRVMHAAGLSPLLVVCGEHARETRAALPADIPLRVLDNPAPERGQLSSLKIALRALQDAPGLCGALVALVDHPSVTVRTLDALTAEAAPPRIVVPRHDGRRGHPVLFGRDLFEELLDADDAQGARPVVRKAPDRVLEVEVDDPGVLLDIDTPDDLRAAQAPKIDR